MATIAAVLLTLAYIKASTARIINACLAELGKAASYDSEPRAFVLTPIHADGGPTWTHDSCGERDSVVRVYCAPTVASPTATEPNGWRVFIGAKVRGGRADRAIGGAVECATQEQAERLLTATVIELSLGRNTGPLTSRLPRAFHGVRFVERPDQVKRSGKAANAVTKVTDDADAAMLALIAEAEAADKPADKPKAQEAPKASK